MIGVAVAGIVTVLLALLFRQQKPEIAMMLSLACCLFIFFCVLAKIRDAMDYIQSLADLIHVDALYMGVILKMIGITYISEFASAICKDAGYASIAGQIQVLAKLSILALGMPVLMAFLSTVEAFL